jgi:hypothetical protein
MDERDGLGGKEYKKNGAGDRIFFLICGIVIFMSVIRNPKAGRANKVFIQFLRSHPVQQTR